MENKNTLKVYINQMQKEMSDDGSSKIGSRRTRRRSSLVLRMDLINDSSPSSNLQTESSDNATKEAMAVVSSGIQFLRNRKKSISLTAAR